MSKGGKRQSEQKQTLRITSADRKRQTSSSSSLNRGLFTHSNTRVSPERMSMGERLSTLQSPLEAVKRLTTLAHAETVSRKRLELVPSKPYKQLFSAQKPKSTNNFASPLHEPMAPLMTQHILISLADEDDTTPLIMSDVNSKIQQLRVLNAAQKAKQQTSSASKKYNNSAQKGNKGPNINSSVQWKRL